MLTIVGFIVVIICVVGGYLLEGGNILVLWQPIELLIIGGAAMGSLLIASSSHLLKEVIHHCVGIFKPSPNDKNKYLQLLMLLFEMIKLAQGGPQQLEAHIEKPENSEIFKKYPLVLHDHHAVEFITNTLLLQISANVSPYDLEDLMDNDIRTIHEEEAWVPKTVNRISDALPGLGIVAAVLGIVITMGKLDKGKEVIGHSVAAALVGTFLGILMSYGFLQPTAAKIEKNIEESGKVLEVVKQALLAMAKGSNPKVCAEFARRSVPMENRPSFADLDKAMRG